MLLCNLEDAGEILWDLEEKCSFLKSYSICFYERVCLLFGGRGHGGEFD